MRAEAQAEEARRAEEQKSAEETHTRESRTQCLVLVSAEGQEEARLCIEGGTLMLMQGERRVEIARL